MCWGGPVNFGVFAGWVGVLQLLLFPPLLCYSLHRLCLEMGVPGLWGEAEECWVSLSE